jgi:16S rRNA (cytidine1402-2'-O)-methyltransferase
MTLYLVGTPIGHRGDMTPRAREVLGEVRTVACEDTRRCRKLFAWLELPAPTLVAFHDHNADESLPRLVERLERGEDVALVTDAGMPAIQDPGYRLVVAARAAGVAVVPVPGPSAFLLALAASGLPSDRFTFLGFAPRKGRTVWWRAALARSETMVVYEAPTRVSATVAEIARIDPKRPLCLAREMTKIHEEFVTGTAEELAETLAARERILGECALVVAGTTTEEGRAAPWPEALAALRASAVGHRLSARDLVDVLSSAYPDARNAIYREVVHAAEQAT